MQLHRNPLLATDANSIELLEVPITYDGKSAADHKFELFALGGSLQGIARIFAVTANFAVTSDYSKHFNTHTVRVYAREPEANCFEMSAIIEFAKQHQIFSGLVGALFTAIVAYVISKASGNREEMKLINARLEQAIQELGHRDKDVIDRMLSTIERMADGLRPAVRNAVQPVGKECDTLTLGQKTDVGSTVIDKAVRDAILSNGENSITDLRDWSVAFTELDKESKTAKLRFPGDESDVRIKAEVSDPAFLLPGNKYLFSYEHDQTVTVKAKALIKGGEIERLYVIDAS